MIIFPGGPGGPRSPFSPFAPCLSIANLLDSKRLAMSALGPTGPGKPWKKNVRLQSGSRTIFPELRLFTDLRSRCSGETVHARRSRQASRSGCSLLSMQETMYECDSGAGNVSVRSTHGFSLFAFFSWKSGHSGFSDRSDRSYRSRRSLESYKASV